MVNSAQDVVSNFFLSAKFHQKYAIQNSKFENQVILEFSHCKWKQK